MTYPAEAGRQENYVELLSACQCEMEISADCRQEDFGSTVNRLKQI